MSSDFDKKIVVLIVEPGEHPSLQSIDNTLETLQKIVGGNIEALYPYSDEVALICNETGKMENLPLNRAVYSEESREMIDIMAGTFIVCGLTEDNFGGLTPDLSAKYSKLFHMPEVFVRTNDGIIAIPQKPSIVKQLHKRTKTAEPSKNPNKERPPEL